MADDMKVDIQGIERWLDSTPRDKMVQALARAAQAGIDNAADGCSTLQEIAGLFNNLIIVPNLVQYRVTMTFEARKNMEYEISSALEDAAETIDDYDSDALINKETFHIDVEEQNY